MQDVSDTVLLDASSALAAAVDTLNQTLIHLGLERGSPPILDEVLKAVQVEVASFNETRSKAIEEVHAICNKKKAERGDLQREINQQQEVQKTFELRLQESQRQYDEAKRTDQELLQAEKKTIQDNRDALIAEKSGTQKLVLRKKKELEALSRQYSGIEAYYRLQKDNADSEIQRARDAYAIEQDISRRRLSAEQYNERERHNVELRLSRESVHIHFEKRQSSLDNMTISLNQLSKDLKEVESRQSERSKQLDVREQVLQGIACSQNVEAYELEQREIRQHERQSWQEATDARHRERSAQLEEQERHHLERQSCQEASDVRLHERLELLTKREQRQDEKEGMHDTIETRHKERSAELEIRAKALEELATRLEAQEKRQADRATRHDRTSTRLEHREQELNTVADSQRERSRQLTEMDHKLTALQTDLSIKEDKLETKDRALQTVSNDHEALKANLMTEREEELSGREAELQRREDEFRKSSKDQQAADARSLKEREQKLVDRETQLQRKEDDAHKSLEDREALNARSLKDKEQKLDARDKELQSKEDKLQKSLNDQEALITSSHTSYNRMQDQLNKLHDELAQSVGSFREQCATLETSNREQRTFLEDSQKGQHTALEARRTSLNDQQEKLQDLHTSLQRLVNTDILDSIAISMARVSITKRPTPPSTGARTEGSAESSNSHSRTTGSQASMSAISSLSTAPILSNVNVDEEQSPELSGSHFKHHTTHASTTSPISLSKRPSTVAFTPDLGPKKKTKSQGMHHVSNNLVSPDFLATIGLHITPLEDLLGSDIHDDSFSEAHLPHDERTEGVGASKESEVGGEEVDEEEEEEEVGEEESDGNEEEIRRVMNGSPRSRVPPKYTYSKLDRKKPVSASVPPPSHLSELFSMLIYPSNWSAGTISSFESRIIKMDEESKSRPNRTRTYMRPRSLLDTIASEPQCKANCAKTATIGKENMGRG
ncbi:hypothetical protein MMC18_005955 [Xylographa bjoerkii]|nr:hypothetical protein [Xylographa bjoerkii]